MNPAPPVSSNAQPTKLNPETEFSSPDKVNSNLVNEDCIGLHQTKFEDNEAPKQMSVTDIINKDSRLMILPSDEHEMTDDQKIDSLPLNHLPPNRANRFRKLFRKYIVVIARNDFDIPANNKIQMPIHLNDTLLSSCYVCVNTPIPAHMIKETRILLAKMLAAGIIVQTDGPQ